MEDQFSDVKKAIEERRVIAYRPCQCDNENCVGMVIDFKENGEEKSVCVAVHREKDSKEK